MKQRARTRILLTTSHLDSISSPYRDMMALAKYLPKDEFDLTICSIIGKSGYRETAPILANLGSDALLQNSGLWVLPGNTLST